jgi:hypothetical protein
MITMSVLNVTTWLMINDRTRVARSFSNKFGKVWGIDKLRVTHHDIRRFLFDEHGEVEGEKMFRRLASEVNSSIDIVACLQDPIHESEMPSHVTNMY